MSYDPNRLYFGGMPNPDKFGYGVYRASGDGPDPQMIETAAQRLNRDVRFIDHRGYEREIIGAAIHPDTGGIAYVESAAKDLGSRVDVTITFHVRGPDERQVSSEIESYNPFFGCDVRLLQWFGDLTVLIYREKHSTYISTFGLASPARYVKIEDDWILNGNTLGYWGYQQTQVRRMTLPDLHELPPISEDEAKSLGLLPNRFW